MSSALNDRYLLMEDNADRLLELSKRVTATVK